MEESHYRALLQEVRSDMSAAEEAIAEAEKSIAELSTLEEYLLTKVEGGGSPSRSKSSSDNRGNSRSTKKPEPEAASDAGGKGMQTVEFGPDGFPST